MKPMEDMKQDIEISAGTPVLKALADEMKASLQSSLPEKTAVSAACFCTVSPVEFPAGGRIVSLVQLEQGRETKCAAFVLRQDSKGLLKDSDLDRIVAAGSAGLINILRDVLGRESSFEFRASDGDKEVFPGGSGFFLCFNWFAGGGGSAVVAMNIPGGILAEMYSRIMPAGAVEEAEAAGLGDFSNMIRQMESAATEFFPDGIPGIHHQTSWVFRGGQCAEMKWNFRFADLFSLGARDMSELITALRKKKLYEDFLKACSGYPGPAVGAVAKVIGARGVKDFQESMGRSGKIAGAEVEAAEFSVMEAALEMFSAGGIAPPEPLKGNLEKTLRETAAEKIFDWTRAVTDLSGLLRSMPKPEIQFAITGLPHKLLAAALFPEPGGEFAELCALVRKNVTAARWEKLTDDVSIVGREHEGQAEELKSLILNARLKCMDAITEMAETGKISDAVFASDKDALGEEEMKRVMGIIRK